MANLYKNTVVGTDYKAEQIKFFKSISLSRGRQASSHLACLASNLRRANGFTLIEVMVVVAVIAILSAIALPSYSEYVMRGRIPDGISPLADMQVRMEQYFQDNRTYVGACQSGTIAPLPSGSQYFNFSCPSASLTANGYVVLAQGKSPGPMSAFAYRMTLAGGTVTRATVSLPTNWTLTTPSTCWVLKRDGTC